MQYFFRSFVYAFRGIYSFFKSERNGKIQGFVALLTMIAGWFFRVQKIEWIFLLCCIGAVISLEMLNSAIERVCNLHTMEYHPAIKIIKDVAAAAVLWAAIISGVIGLLIFIPYVASFLHL